MRAREQVFSTPTKGVLDPCASGSTVPEPKVNAVARLRIWAFEAHHRRFQCNTIYLVGSAEQRQWNSEAERPLHSHTVMAKQIPTDDRTPVVSGGSEEIVG